MSQIFNQFNLRSGEQLLKYTLVILTIFLISLLFPNTGRFKYDFEQGQIWKYESLYAPQEFAIKKPIETFEAERQNVIDGIRDYYRKKDNLTTVEQQFESIFEEALQGLDPAEHAEIVNNPSPYLEAGKTILREYYEQSVVADDSPAAGTTVNVVTENVVNVVETKTRSDIINQVRQDLSNSRLPHASLLYPVLEEIIQPNLILDQEVKNKFIQNQLEKISSNSGMVAEGELIVPQDGLITEEVYQKLNSLRDHHEQEASGTGSNWLVFGGYLLLTSLIVGIYLIYLQYYNKRIFASWRKLLFMLMWLLLFGYLVYLVEQNETLSAYMIPFCIAPIVIKTFYSERLALFALIVIVLIASFLSHLGYEFTFLQILAGVVAVLSNEVTRYLSRFFRSILWILVAYGLGYLGLSLIKDGSFAAIDWTIFAWLFVSVVLTLLAYPLIPLLERLFGFISNITLAELADLDRPLLRELGVKAAGTMQHSLQVGNLSEAAVDAIGGNTLLVKVAALYHDIGKMKNPTFFIENQGEVNPHDTIPEVESAGIIIDHVLEGEKMAKKHGLPRELVRFIKTHHGTTRVEFFYQKHLEKFPNGEPSEPLFRYPGPRPRSKEETVMMMADSIEAACKSLKQPTEQQISEKVDAIIAKKMSTGQFEESELTFEELEMVRSSFKSVLKSIHHVRIEYPKEKEEQKLPDDGSKASL